VVRESIFRISRGIAAKLEFLNTGTGTGVSIHAHMNHDTYSYTRTSYVLRIEICLVSRNTRISGPIFSFSFSFFTCKLPSGLKENSETSTYYSYFIFHTSQRKIHETIGTPVKIRGLGAKEYNDGR